MSSLVVGDKVRATAMKNKALDKGTDPKWTDQVFKVTAVKGNTITLEDGNVYKRNDLLRVPGDTPSTDKNAIAKEKAEIDALRIKSKQKVNPNKVKQLLGSALRSKAKKKEVVKQKEGATSAYAKLKPRDEGYLERTAREKAEKEAKETAKRSGTAVRTTALKLISGVQPPK